MIDEHASYSNNGVTEYRRGELEDIIPIIEEKHEIREKKEKLVLKFS